MPAVRLSSGAGAGRESGAEAIHNEITLQSSDKQGGPLALTNPSGSLSGLTADRCVNCPKIGGDRYSEYCVRMYICCIFAFR